MNWGKTLTYNGCECLALIGTVLRSRPLEEKAALAQRVRRELLPLFTSGTLRPVIDSRYPFDDIAGAHAHMETNANIGKIMIDLPSP